MEGLSTQGIIYLTFSVFYAYVIYFAMKFLMAIKKDVHQIKLELVLLRLGEDNKKALVELNKEVDKVQAIVKPVRKKSVKK